MARHRRSAVSGKSRSTSPSGDSASALAWLDERGIAALLTTATTTHRTRALADQSRFVTHGGKGFRRVGKPSWLAAAGILFYAFLTVGLPLISLTILAFSNFWSPRLRWANVTTDNFRKVFAESPGEFDPRKYLGPARQALVEMYKRKNREVLGSAGRYGEELTA